MQGSSITPATIRQIFFLLLLGLIGGILVYYLKFFLSGFLGALVLYILLREPYFYLVEKKKWNKNIIIGMLFLATVLILLLPLWLVTMLLSQKIAIALANYELVLHTIEEWFELFTSLTGFDLLTEESISKFTTAATKIIPKILNFTLDSLAQLALMFFVLYFMLANGRSFEVSSKSYSPFDKSATNTLLLELKTMTISNVLGVPILSIIQALFAGFGYWILGVEEPVIWAIVTGLFSIVPILGTAIVWVPLCIFLYTSELRTQAYLLFGYGSLIITNVDNVFRFVVLKKIGDVHPLITILGVFVGISLFGVTGIIFGPLLIAYFIILIKMYKSEYGIANHA